MTQGGREGGREGNIEREKEKEKKKKVFKKKVEKIQSITRDPLVTNPLVTHAMFLAVIPALYPDSHELRVQF